MSGIYMYIYVCTYVWSRKVKGFNVYDSRRYNDNGSNADVVDEVLSTY